MRVCISQHDFVAGKIHDIFHVIDDIGCLATWPTPELSIVIPSSTTTPSLILLLLPQTNESLSMICSDSDTIVCFTITKQQNTASGERDLGFFRRDFSEIPWLNISDSVAPSISLHFFPYRR